MLGLAILVLFASVAEAQKDKHELTCSDSDNSYEVSQIAATTHFTWHKNGELLFDRTFRDGYAASRDQYITFFCEGNIIRYQPHSCDEESMKALCKKNTAETIKLTIGQRNVSTSQTLIDGDDYRFISHYQFSKTEAPVRVTGLYFVNDVDNQNAVSTTEHQAAEQYQYVLLGPEGELQSGVSTSNGRLYFDLSSNPILVDGEDLNIGLGAQAKSGLATTNNSSIRWMLDSAVGAQGVVAEINNQPLTFDEISLASSKPDVFSRGTSGLKINHFVPQAPLTQPSNSAQPFYRFTITNLSSANAAGLKRGTLDMRVMGLQRSGGAALQASDFSLHEIDASGNSLGTVAANLSIVEDSRNGATAASLRFEFSSLTVPAGSQRMLEVRVANIANDQNNESNDDGVAVQLRTETFNDGSKLSLEDLGAAQWIWSDEPGNPSGWRSGVNMTLDLGAVVMKE